MGNSEWWEHYHYEHQWQWKRTKYTVPQVDKGTSLHCYYVKMCRTGVTCIFTFLHNSSEGMFLCVPEELYILSAFFVRHAHSVCKGSDFWLRAGQTILNSTATLNITNFQVILRCLYIFLKVHYMMGSVSSYPHWKEADFSTTKLRKLIVLVVVSILKKVSSSHNQSQN